MIRTLFCAALVLALAACNKGPDDQALLQSAQAHIDAKDYRAAGIELKNLLQREPDSKQGRLLMGRLLLLDGDAKAAAIELAKAHELGVADDDVVPDLARALLGAGERAALIGPYSAVRLGRAEGMADLQASLAAAHAGQNNPDAARQAVAAALAAVPGYPAAQVVLARLELAAGNTAAALRPLDQVLAAQPGHEAAGLLKADILLASGAQQAPAAITLLQQVRDANAKSVAAHGALVSALVQANRLDDARKAFEPMKQINARHPETLFLQAQFAFADGNNKAAAEALDALLAKAPNNLRALTLAGAAQLRLGQAALAEGFLARALKAAPDLAVARHLLAQTYLQTGQAARALEALQPLLATKPVSVDTLALAGEAFLQAGDAARSEAAFREALKASPSDAALQVEVANAQLARGERAPALAQLESIARSDPGIRADQALINERIRSGDTKGALKAIDTLEKKLPDRAYPLGIRARVLARSGDTAGAVAAYDKALAKDPKYLPAAIGLAELDFAAGQLAQARKRIEAVIAADPRNVHPRLALVELETRAGTNEATLTTLLREAVKADPTQPAGHLALVNRLVLAGNGAAAVTAAQEASVALPQDASVIDALGRAQLAAGDARGALASFKRLTTMQPAEPMHLVRLAQAQGAMGDADAAAGSLRQALKLQPEHGLAQRNLALLLVQGNRVSEAVALARAQQQKNPKDSAAFALEGELQSAANNPAAAAAAYREALKRQPGDSNLAVRAHRHLVAAGAADAQRMADDWLRANPQDLLFTYHLGDMAVAAKDWPRAEQHFRKVLQLQPRQAAGMNNLAYVMAAQRKPGAVAMAEQAVALLPDRAPLLDTLAFAQEAEGKLDLAVVTQQRAVALDPKAPELRLHLAQLLAKQGQKAEALKLLEALDTLGPAFPSQAEVAALMKTLR